MPANSPLDPAYLAHLRRDLLRFARLQLRDDHLAEDVVQDALTAACLSSDAFSGRAQHKTWVFAILRNKLIDMMRARRRTINASALEGEAGDDSVFDRELFNDNGHWTDHARPRPWPRPETLVARQHFWQLFDWCLNALPESTGRVFSMRELLEMDITEICQELGLEANHCSVLLYRARTRLRTCLSAKGLETNDAIG
ncbi:sigma-70 family RNA polymerase sigma factor [Pandoraea capi]|uniref:sigma-70 family RNA polymerase sigma factor n=1 Tax=Pandoraea TaxID=93217 RepID=UPI001F5CBFD8|nr:sigma-70 family RNA polymerase sigma factor [Pandoraea capi]MCI3206845.1 RNA polymerase subunit sigma [Pandoraea sp. LA3]MDN4584873.1 RNA polymerase subunit sigma [Pandoraea capi]